MKRATILFTLLFTASLLVAQSWETVASLPGGTSDARHHPVTFSIDGFGYLLTGTVNSVESDDFMRYDPITDTWEELPDFPGGARSYAYGTARGSKAYVGFGGADDVATNDLWEYDSETETWTELEECPCQSRYHPAFIQLEDKIYVGMGNYFANYKDWWEYDIPTNTWTEKDDLPGPPRHHPFYFGIDGIAYVGFGHGNDGIGGQLNVYNDFYKFDPETDEWTQLADFPGEGRVAGTQFDYNGKGYVLSGDGDDHSFMEEGELWEYDPLSDTWTQLPSHPGSSRWAPGSFVIDNYVYFMCGLSNVTLESDMMRFELEELPTTSIENLSDASIDVFPNPANDLITIVQDIAPFSQVRLVNSYGQLVRVVMSNQVSVSDLPNGTYYMQFATDETVVTKPFMIIH